MQICAVALRSVPRLLVVAATLLQLTLPASADPDTNGDIGARLNDWVTRARATVAKHADKIPPEWARYIPHPASMPDLGSMRGGKTMSAADLDRVMIGYQAGVLKIVSADNRVVFVKRRPGSDMVAIDSTEYAPIDEGQYHEILGALRIREEEAEAAAIGLMQQYSRLPRTKALAVLGVLLAAPDLNAASRVRSFLCAHLRDGDVKEHRMAVLSLALSNQTDERTVSAVLDFMDHSRNAWETFTTQQFFQYHRDEIRSFSSASNVRRRLASSGNPYGASIASNF